MFHKRQNSLNRYFASEGKMALGDILPQETRLTRLPIVYWAMGGPVWKRINVVGPRAVNRLNVAGYGRSGREKSWTVVRAISAPYNHKLRSYAAHPYLTQCCHSVIKKNPRIYLEKKTQKIIKKPRHTKCLKPNLKSTLPVVAHKNYGSMHYLHHIFNKFKCIFKHTDNHNLQVG